jgi:hypothetical protein
MGGLRVGMPQQWCFLAGNVEIIQYPAAYFFKISTRIGSLEWLIQTIYG